MRKVAVLLIFGLLCMNNYAQTFTLKSNDLTGQIVNDQVFNNFGCTGANISPQLYWENAPTHTKSFAITMYDPDAPTGSGWWHWLVFNIPSSAKELKQGAGSIDISLLPQGSIQSRTDFGRPGYGGPCPPEGDDYHRYVFTIHALKIKNIGLDENASPAMVGFYLNENTIAKSSIISYFKR